MVSFVEILFDAIGFKTFETCMWLWNVTADIHVFHLESITIVIVVLNTSRLMHKVPWHPVQPSYVNIFGPCGGPVCEDIVNEIHSKCEPEIAKPVSHATI